MFRIYRTPVEWIDENTTQLRRADTTFNLYDVAQWEQCSDDRLNAHDNKPRTGVFFKNGAYQAIPMKKEDFEAVMLDFLYDIGAVDERSLPGGKIEIKLARTHYKGPIRWIFKENHGALGVTVFPKFAKLSTPEDLYIQNLYGGVTSLS